MKSVRSNSQSMKYQRPPGCKDIEIKDLNLGLRPNSFNEELDRV